MARKRLWYVACRWSVEMIARRDAPSVGKKAGEWIPIYCAPTRTAAKAQIVGFKQLYGSEPGDRFRIVPGEGHKTRRGF